MTDCQMTVEDVMLLMEPIAVEIGRRYPRKEGIDRDDLISEACLAMCEAAHRYFEELPGITMDLERWIKRRIRDHLSDYVRDRLFAFLADVPSRLKRRAIQVHTATERIKARGILRPTYEQIAGEARVSVEAVVSLSIFKAVIVRQSLIEWCEDRGGERAGEPTGIAPIFGPQPGFSPLTPCSNIHHGRIPKGDKVYCPVCHKSGVDGHPALRRSKATDPAPEVAREAPPAPTRKPSIETRVQIRARLYPPQAVTAVA
jgi:hypothetical protein